MSVIRYIINRTDVKYAIIFRMEQILCGIIVLMAVIIGVLIRRNMYLGRSIDGYVAEDKERSHEINSIAKFENLASELAQLRRDGLKDRKVFFETVLDSACALLNSGRGSLMLYDEAYDELIVIAARNIEREFAENVHMAPGEGIAGRAFKTGEIIYVTDPETNSQYVGFENLPGQKEPFIAVPVKTSRRTYCVLNLHLTSGNARFTDYELKMLTLLADEAALIIENQRLKQALDPDFQDKENAG